MSNNKDYANGSSRAPRGVVALDDRFYVERDADSWLIKDLLRSGTTITLCGPHQSGKSSLLLRGLHHVHQHGAKVILIDLESFPNQYLSSFDTFIYNFAKSILRQLRLDVTRAEKLRDSTFTPQISISELFEDYILPEVNSPVILAIDEADRVVEADFHNDFFCLIRSWDQSRFQNPFKEVSFVIASTAEPQFFIRDVPTSPFNIGDVIKVGDFGELQVRDLNERYGLPIQDDDLQQLMDLLGGHPYLTRQAFHMLATRRMTWIDLNQVAISDQGPFSDHLQYLLHWLLHSELQLRRAFEQIIQHGKCRDELSLLRLQRMGLVKRHGEFSFIKQYTCRCKLYELYFKDKLMEPSDDIESKRQVELELGQNIGDAAIISILFLSADPTDTSQLRLGEELREIQEKLQSAKMRDRFLLHQRMSVRPVDISQALLDEQPQIVHFSGHGTVAGALCIENQIGETRLVQPDALAALFEQFANQVKCVLLNACYSETQAYAIAQHIDYVIGMNQAIGDKAAVAFVIGFYQALGAGRTIYEAYKLGCVQIRLQGIPEHLTPVLIKKDEVQ